jgi:hypothetical protein
VGEELEVASRLGGSGLVAEVMGGAKGGFRSMSSLGGGEKC